MIRNSFDKILPSLFCLILATTPSLASDSISLDNAEVSFLVIGKPAMLKINGTSQEHPQGELKLIALKDGGFEFKGKLEFNLDSFDTGIGMRNRHMKEKYLEIKKFQNATLSLTEARLPSTFKDENFSGEIPFSGKLSLHGIERDVNGKANVKKSATKLHIDAHLKLVLTDFALEIPSFKGITVANTVEVTVLIKHENAH